MYCRRALSAVHRFARAGEFEKWKTIDHTTYMDSGRRLEDYKPPSKYDWQKAKEEVYGIPKPKTVPPFPTYVPEAEQG